MHLTKRCLGSCYILPSSNSFDVGRWMWTFTKELSIELVDVELHFIELDRLFLRWVHEKKSTSLNTNENSTHLHIHLDVRKFIH